jgi:uncharacterized protein
MQGSLDVLVVDEAGQMALANAIAVGPAAGSLVFLGDPQQLRQPSHGSHPPGVDRSVLDHLVGDEDTMPPQFGLFLETTYRMHPAVCSYISEVFYDGKLEPDPMNVQQEVLGQAPAAGLLYKPVPHTGNRTISLEEVEQVGATVRELLGRPWRDRHKNIQQLLGSDILVVAPYNAQVRWLMEKLPQDVRVGTVDKFQGQQAPVVIYSMATSSADDAPRGVDFLFSLNRLNVAVSRARSLAILVASPSLLMARCRNPRQMRLVSALCRFVEQASG